MARAARVSAEQQARNHARGKLETLRARPRAEAYREFLRDAAQAGDLRALSELRRIGVPEVAPERDWISGTGHDRAGFVLPDFHIDSSGSVSYSVNGRVAVVDAPSRVQVVRGDPAAYETALRVAVTRYGGVLKLNGDEQFRRGMIEAAKRTGMRLTLGMEGVPGLEAVQINSPARSAPGMRR